MVFWSIVGAVLLVVLVAAWRVERRQKVTITRRNPSVERDIATAYAQGVANYQRAQSIVPPQ